MLSDTSSADEALWASADAVENGDANGDWARDVSDAIYLLGHLFAGGPGPVPVHGALCPESAAAPANGDLNADGGLDISDAIYLLSWLYAGGPEPFPFDCGAASGIGLGAGQKTTAVPIAWRAEGGFSVAFTPEGQVVFSGVTAGLRVSHLGLSSIVFEIAAVPVSPVEVVIVGGTAVFTAADGDELAAIFTGGALDLATGVYHLLWDLDGGTGRFSDAVGQGRTDGIVDLAAGSYRSKNLGTISY
jgi:hypothetical protein